MTRQQAVRYWDLIREARRAGETDLDLDGPSERNGGDEPRYAGPAPKAGLGDWTPWKPTAADLAWIEARADHTRYRYSWELKRYVPETDPETGQPGS